MEQSIDNAQMYAINSIWEKLDVQHEIMQVQNDTSVLFRLVYVTEKKL